MRKTTYKIGIYVRVSTEEQAENPEGSIKNQELRLREFVKLKNMVAPFGEIVQIYSDPGKSAKDMNRPSFQRLMQAIENREVSLILVTELSRLTRSIKDFSLLQEFLKSNECEFLSLRENFDTTSATGGMVLNIMATIAEFERRQTAERISNSFHQRAKRGLYNGGSVPLGYRIDPDRPGHLAIVPEEAEIIRLIFKKFLEIETLMQTTRWLNDQGLAPPRKVQGGGAPRSKIFRIDMLHHILHNKAYIGKRVFKSKEGKEEVKAAWEPIIDDETFQRVEKLLKSNISRKRTHKHQRYPFTLTGLLNCKVCGGSLCGKSAHGRNGKIPYYEHSHANKVNSCLNGTKVLCDLHRIQAAKIEPVVWQDVKAFLTDRSFAEELIASARSLKNDVPTQSELEVAEKRLGNVVDQVEVLAERISTLPKAIDPKALYAQLSRLQTSQASLEIQCEDLKSQAIPTDDPIDYADLGLFTSGLRRMLKEAEKNPELKAAIIKKIVHKIDITPQGINTHYFIGHGKYKQYKKASGDDSPEASNFKVPDFFKVAGSTFLTNGGGGGS